MCSLQNPRHPTHEEAFSKDDDRVMVRGGAASLLLEFDLQPIRARHQWRNVVHRQRYEATLRQHRDVTRADNLGEEVTQALRRSIQQQIAADCTLTPHSTMHFTMQSRAFTHAYQSTTFTVCEFEEGSEQLNTYLQTLADKLNFNEEFAPDDTFSMETTFIHTAGTGSRHSKQFKLSCVVIQGIVKRSRITIKNKDNLCRAIK